MGCQLNQKNACLIGSLPVSDIIDFALQVGARLIVAAVSNGALWFVVFWIVVIAWLVVCYVALTLGWVRTRTRLLLGIAVTLVFAVVPYFGPMVSITNLVNEKCKGGVGSCLMFGGRVGLAYEAVEVGWLFILGAPIALAAFVIYAIFAILVRGRSTPITSAQ